MKKILVVAAHADDEVLGCGGTIARHIANGDKVQVVFMADGVESRDDHGEGQLAQRNQAAENVKNLLGIESLYFLGLRDNRLDSYNILDVVKLLENIINIVKPEVVYTHHYGDLNVDHRVTHQAVLTACRPTPDFFVKKIYAFEVLSSTEWQSPGLNTFLPNVFVDITDCLSIKVKALEIYKDEMRASPHSRSIDNLQYLARYRGHSIGCNAAEAFMLIRELV